MQISAAVGLLLSGCNLPGIPVFGPRERTEDSSPTTTGSAATVCAPATRECIGNAVRMCAADGQDFFVEACNPGDTCSEGTCAPIQNTCRGGQSFALSANEVAFDTSDDLKTQTKQLRLENCSSRSFVVRGASIRAPDRPDGDPVFELAAEVAQTTLPPGGELDLKVRYRPTLGLSHVDGELELSLVLDELSVVEIPLRSKALCITASPRLTLGVSEVREPLEAAGVLQNCGTEPMRLAGWNTSAGLDVDFSEKVPYTLVPGEQVAYNIQSIREQAGFAPGGIDFLFDDTALTASTRVDGLITEPGCTPLLLWEPQILANNLVRQPEPDDLVRVRFPGSPDRIAQWLVLADRPEGHVGEFRRGTDGFTLRPRVVGDYRGLFAGFDTSTGKISCGRTEFEFSVRPLDGLHVELTWEADGDAIVDDTGYGHGVNLDLHVLSSSDASAAWNDEAADCFPGVPGACGEVGGTVYGSQSGGVAELVSFGDVADRTFEVGVYLSNPFNFAGADATVRVYDHGELVAQLRSASLRVANDFWLVGKFDGSTGAWTDIDRTFNGFPK